MSNEAEMSQNEIQWQMESRAEDWEEQRTSEAIALLQGRGYTVLLPVTEESPDDPF